MTPEVRQSTCVLVQGCAVLIDGQPGSGKSSLALALIDRGAMLVGDDGVTLDLRDGVLWASPPPNTARLIEIRNVGLASLPAGLGPVGLVIRLDTAAPRFIDGPGTEEIMGVRVPLVSLYPDAATLPLRAEWAVRMHAWRP